MVLHSSRLRHHSQMLDCPQKNLSSRNALAYFVSLSAKKKKFVTSAPGLSGSRLVYVSNADVVRAINQLEAAGRDPSRAISSSIGCTRGVHQLFFRYDTR
jgi:hypothetical protein